MLLGTSVYLLDSLRSRLSEGIDDISDRARETYSEASRRANRGCASCVGWRAYAKFSKSHGLWGAVQNATASSRSPGV